MKAMLLLAALALSAPARAAAPDPRELAAALSPERLGLASGEATIAMELRDKAGRVVSRTLRARSATTKDGARTTRKMRLTFLEPADQRGVELLVVDGAEPLQYLWLPRSAELRRIAASDRDASFQGSDLSFADFEERDLAAADVSIVGEETVAGLAAFRVAIRPKPGTTAPGGWSEVVATIAADARVPLKVEFFRAGVLARRLDVKRLQPVEGRLVPTRLVMSDLARGTRTTLDISGSSPSATFPDAVFLPESLGR